MVARGRVTNWSWVDGCGGRDGILSLNALELVVLADANCWVNDW